MPCFVCACLGRRRAAYLSAWGGFATIVVDSEFLNPIRNMNELKKPLLDEMVACIHHGVPLPNTTVYDRPWIRDAAMMAMVLERVGELNLIRTWIEGLVDPFDRNNGSEEPDNLGQALYLASLIGDDSHPIVVSVLSRLPEFLAPDGTMLGTTDFAVRPCYAGRWLNFGLAKLGRAPLARIPADPDDYDCLFWMDGLKSRTSGSGSWEAATDYPYLAWASAHSYQEPPPLHLLGRIPGILTWESEASAADYSKIPSDSAMLQVPRTCAPHSWHAAEAWLYLDDLDSRSA